MADRSLYTVVEDRLYNGPHFRLRVERSAAGQPGLVVTIEHTDEDDDMINQLTVVVKDAEEMLVPIIAWLDGVDVPVEPNPEQIDHMRNAWYFVQNAIKHEETDQEQSRRDRINSEKEAMLAVKAGVPRPQVDRFVSWKPTDA